MQVQLHVYSHIMISIFHLDPSYQDPVDLGNSPCQQGELPSYQIFYCSSGLNYRAASYIE